jgi:hypothetical protein
MPPKLTAGDQSVLDYLFSRDHGYSGQDVLNAVTGSDSSDFVTSQAERSDDREALAAIRALQARAIVMAEAAVPRTAPQEQQNSGASQADEPGLLDALKVLEGALTMAESHQTQMQQELAESARGGVADRARLVVASVHNDLCQVRQLMASAVLARPGEVTSDREAEAKKIRETATANAEQALALCERVTDQQSSTGESPAVAPEHFDKVFAPVAERALVQRAMLREISGDEAGASRDFARAAQLGSGIATSENVRRNPMAKLCHAMVQKALEAESWE